MKIPDAVLETRGCDIFSSLVTHVDNEVGMVPLKKYVRPGGGGKAEWEREEMSADSYRDTSMDIPKNKLLHM